MTTTAMRGAGAPIGALRGRFGAWAAWLLPFAALALLLAWETDWGRRFGEAPVPEDLAGPAPVQVSLLPEFAIPGGPEARRETVERTLFNPTRRPAPPPPVQDASKPKLQRGQFTLTGTAVAGSTTIAFLRETNGGRARSARPGDVINGMTVAEVKPDRVKLTLGDESEDVVLRVASGPKTTTQPAGAVVQGPGAPGQPVGAGQPGGPVPAAAVTPGTTGASQAAIQAQEAQTLLERRRAARAAAAGAEASPAAGAPAATPAAPAVANPAVPPGTPATATPQADPRWAEVYKRMMQRGN